MDEKKAFEIISQALSEIRITMRDHEILKEAMSVVGRKLLKEAEPLETSKEVE